MATKDLAQLKLREAEPQSMIFYSYLATINRFAIVTRPFVNL